MAFLLDTNVLIHLRDGDAAVSGKIAALDGAVLMSVVTRDELEGGVHRDPTHAALRRQRLDVILAAVPSLALDGAAAEAYTGIVARVGYSRRKLLARMFAAQALLHRATLVTLNAEDFSDIAGLDLLAW